MTELSSMVLEHPAPRATDSRRDLPPDVDRVIARCLEKDPNSRFPNAQALAQALRTLRERPPAQVTAAPPTLERPLVTAAPPTLERPLVTAVPFTQPSEAPRLTAAMTSPMLPLPQVALPPPAVARPRKRSGVVLAAVVAVLVIAVLVGAWSALRTSDDGPDESTAPTATRKKKKRAHVTPTASTSAPSPFLPPTIPELEDGEYEVPDETDETDETFEPDASM